MFTNATLQEQIARFLQEPQPPPNEDLDGNVAVATHDAIDGLQIRSGQFLPSFSKHLVGQKNACVATATRICFKN